MRRDRVDRRITALAKRLDAEEFTIQVNYDTRNRYRFRPEAEWMVDIAWCRGSLGDYPSEERTTRGQGRTLTGALDALDQQVNALLFLDGTTSVNQAGEASQ